MSRLRRFEGHRFVGRRDTMVVYDCDDPTQFEELAPEADQLLACNQLQAFGPDVLEEALNRGFRPR